MNDALPGILYIEDNLDNQRLVQRILGNQGYHVVVANDGPSGLALAREMMPVIILVDLGIPGLDGYETTTRLRSLIHLHNVPIVALTADGSPGARERALVAGCDGYLVKPIDPRRLPMVVSEFIAGHRERVSAPAEEADLLRAYSQKLVERLEQRVLELSAANAELGELDRLKSQFLSTLSHELRTPMTSLMGYLELFEQGMLGPLTQDQQEGLVVMRRSSETLSQQLNNLLYFQELRGRTMEPQMLDPVATLKPTFESFQERARGEGVLMDVVTCQAAPILADDKSLTQMTQALLDNAVKYTPRGGRIRLLFHDEPSRFILRCEDNGPGIGKEHLEKIFLPFYRVEPPNTTVKPGAGLGLAIARHIAEAHGAQLTVRSQVRIGTVFTVVFPR